MTITRTLNNLIIPKYCFIMLFDMFVTVIDMEVTTLFETEVKNLIFIVKQFLENECSLTLETLENKIWIGQKLSHPCTIKSYSESIIFCFLKGNIAVK